MWYRLQGKTNLSVENVSKVENVWQGYLKFWVPVSVIRWSLDFGAVCTSKIV